MVSRPEIVAKVERAIALHAKGLDAPTIGERLGMTANQVRAILSRRKQREKAGEVDA